MTKAKDLGWAICPTCRTITDRPEEKCIVCGTSTPIRKPKALQWVWAFWLAGVLTYIPGNVLPIMVTESVAGESSSTILGGVISLMNNGSVFIAAIIFIASIAVPISKFAIIAWLSLSIQFRWSLSNHRRHQAHEVIEFIGRWSMIDVFVVAALAALIQVGGLLAVAPGLGIDSFALSVIFTMLSANNLDPRMIWDREHQLEGAHVTS